MAETTTPRFASRMDRISGEGAIETLAKALALEAQGRDIVHLEVGEPDFDTPPYIVEGGVHALREGHTHYTPAPGISALREAIAQEVAISRGIPVKPEQVVVTPGGKPIIFFALLALVEQGDEVVIPDPGFPTYASVARFAGGTVVPLSLREERGFRFDRDEFLAALSPRTKVIIVNSPQNPTGGVLEPTDLETIAEAAVERNLWVLSDEVYRHLTYDGEFRSIASLGGMEERTIILDGFSKRYAMTGWRLGYGVMPVGLAEAVTRLAINSHSCVASFVQLAGVAALRGPQDEVVRMASAFRQRRDLVVGGLNTIPGLRCVRPNGAFYVFPNIEGTGLDSSGFANYLLEEASVAVLPGTAFGPNGEGFLRISYANSEENLRKALDRIAAAASKL